MKKSRKILKHLASNFVNIMNIVKIDKKHFFSRFYCNKLNKIKFNLINK